MSTTHWIYGLHAVTAALRRGSDDVQELVIDAQRKDARIHAVAEAATRAGVTSRRASGQVLNELVSGARHQGVAARVHHLPTWDEADLQRLLDDSSTVPFLLILDGVQDPHNLGACLRTADAAGVHAVIAPRDRAAGLTPTVRKVASGAAESVPFIPVTNLARSLRQVRDHGVIIVGADGEAEESLYNLDLRGPLAIALGAEGSGLRRLTKEHCDFLTRLPMAGSVESLNVSVAAGVCLFEAVRQRG